MSDRNNKTSNHLGSESSPYLLQHAYNPVNWYPWGKEALEKSVKEDKMLIISIGYAACHWCHVMEHESFEDKEVAEIMNAHFISIKVDREERPDIDDVYMTACQLVNASGCGWPLNAFALPDGRPVWAGTYFPKEKWIDVLSHFVKMKSEDPQRLQRSAEALTKGVSQYGMIDVEGEMPMVDSELIDTLVQRMLGSVDFHYGGSKGAPKFPMPNNYEFLLKYHFLTQNPEVKNVLQVTLDQMAAGGIFDHVGGGFARYSVDALWKVPHFEKMLYDNGQLLSLYSQAYAHFKAPQYKYIATKIADFMIREMQDELGGFYSSYDADSEGEEGRFYVWDADELKSLLGDDYQVIADYYSIKAEGNWEGQNILHISRPVKKIIDDHNLPSVTELNEIIVRANAMLYTEREKRIKPALDNKVLTSWNGLAISGLLDIYRYTGDQKYMNSAMKAATYLKGYIIKEDYRMDRNFMRGKSSINGFLEDYATVISSFVSLYELSLDSSWLDLARNLCEYSIEHFYDEKQNLFQFTNKQDPPLATYRIDYHDNVIPSYNSIMARNLYKLGTLNDDKKWIEMSQNMVSQVIPIIGNSRQPGYFSNWCQLLLDMVYNPFEVVIMGDKATDYSVKMQQQFHPDAIYSGGMLEHLPLHQFKLREDETTIYVCVNKTCKLPVNDVDEARLLMKR